MDNSDNTLLPHLRLQFNLDYPDLADCYLFGYEASTKGLDESDNPFPVGSKESFQWQEGYWDAIYNEKPIFAGLAPDKSIKTNPVPLIKAAEEDRLIRFLRITGALIITLFLGYELVDLML